VSEWLKVPLSKSGEVKASVGSNPTLSAKNRWYIRILREAYGTTSWIDVALPTDLPTNCRPCAEFLADASVEGAGMTTVVLLGAGAAAEGGIPTSREMTRRMATFLEEGQIHVRGDVLAAFKYACGQIMAASTDPFLDPDLEMVFSAIELLANRGILEVSPFVAAWDAGVSALDRRLRWPSGVRVGDAVETYVNGLAGGITPPRDAIDRAVRDVIREETGETGGQTFRELLDIMLLALRQLTTVASATPFAYLTPLFDLARRQGLLTIASLNYDRSIEVLGDALGVEVDTGIQYWSDKGTWSWRNSGVRLLKLHGSMDWTLAHRGGTAGQLPRQELELSHEDQPWGTPLVIFGQRTKLRADGPFLDLLREFAGALEEASSLVVIGYSFRDAHVNEYLRRWLNAEITRRIEVVDPNFPVSPRPFQPGVAIDFSSELLSYLIPPPRPAPLQEDFAPRLTVYRKNASEAIRTALGLDDALPLGPPPSGD
jgi:hypothetical protein